MTAPLLAAFVAAYFLALLLVAWRTSRGANNESFFIGNRSSRWGLVAFGMIGTSLSGVTFISVPGAVGATSWHYLQIVLGQFIGYGVITFVLLPLYYRLRLTSIYHYLATRLGPASYRTGAGFFILSRTLGATARLYLVVKILQDTLLAQLGMPFWLSAAIILLMIVLYTYQGGVKTIVSCTLYLLAVLHLSPVEGWQRMREAGLATVFGSDIDSRAFWVKQIVAGIFIAIAMTGMDQEMMQKNISVRTLRDAQKNMMTLAVIMVVVVALFLYLGGLLHLFKAQAGLDARGDALFPAVVMAALPVAMQLVFVLALISALFPSADGALTALTSSSCIDLLGMQQRADWDEARRQRIRHAVHLGFAALFMALVLGFRWLDDPSMIGLILRIAGYTYGPLLGLFAFGILTRRVVRDRCVPAVAIVSPLLCGAIDATQSRWFGRYEIGLEMLMLNGAITFAGLWWLSSRPAPRLQPA